MREAQTCANRRRAGRGYCAARLPLYNATEKEGPKRKEDVAQIIGKTIKHIVAKENPTAVPAYPLFLIFTDDTYYEFWCNAGIAEIQSASSLQSGGQASVRNRGENIVVDI